MLAPRLASEPAIPRPIPDVEPVIIAVLPSMHILLSNDFQHHTAKYLQKPALNGLYNSIGAKDMLNQRHYLAERE